MCCHLSATLELQVPVVAMFITTFVSHLVESGPYAGSMRCSKILVFRAFLGQEDIAVSFHRGEAGLNLAIYL